MAAFFFKAIVWGVFTYFVASGFAANEFWIVVSGVFLFSVPIVLSCFYLSTIVQIRKLAFFTRKGWLYYIFSRRVFKAVFWVCWALFTSVFMLVQFHTYSTIDWVAFFLVIPAFWLFFALGGKLFSTEIRPFLVTSTSLNWARWVTPFVMLLLYMVLAMTVADYPHYVSLQEAVDINKARVSGMTGSAFVFELSHYMAYYSASKAYFLGRLGGPDSLLAAGVLSIGSLVVFYNACAILSCFLISRLEYRRVFGPLTDSEIPPPVEPRRIAIISGVFTFFALFIYLPSFTAIEYHVRQNPGMAQDREAAETYIVKRLEQIDNQFFRPGTIEQLNQAKIEILQRAEESISHLEDEVDKAFDLLKANVDRYLDWYYSLPAEYYRIGKLLVGQLEDYMIEKLEAELFHGDPFASVDLSLEKAILANKDALEAYRVEAVRIMDQNRVDELPAGIGLRIVQSASIENILNPSMPGDVINLNYRLAGGAAGSVAGGTVTAVVAKKVIGKVAGKNMFKLAIKTMVKAVAGKAAGSAGGAAGGAKAGAAVGTVVWPGIGTAAGAVIGGIAGGIVAGVSVDKLLLMVEDAVNREEFRKEILAAIRETREEFKAELFKKPETDV